MEQCWAEGHLGGTVLLQRWTSTFAVARELPPFSANGSPRDVLLQMNSSATHDPVSLLVANFGPLSYLANHIASNLPNITSYEENQKELGSSLLLNIGVFALGVVVWAICPCVAGMWTRKSSSQDADESPSSASIGAEGNQMDRSQLNIHAAVPQRNYLLYLLVCMYACMVLCLVNVCFLLPHGLVGQVLFGGWSILMVLGQVSIAEIYIITFVDGCIVLAFTKLYESLIELPEKDLAQEQLKRAVWMKGLPTHDTMRWWKPFRVSPLEVGRVRHDLMDAITDYFRDEHHDEGTPGRSSLGPVRAATESSSGSGLQLAPSSLPPVDLKGTPWQCHLEDGNPYYRNIVTGAVQWEPPAELVGQSRSVDSPVVEEIYISLVLDEWHHAHTELQQAREYLAAYQERFEIAERDVADEERAQVWRFFRRPASWWYGRKVRLLEPLIEVLSYDLEKIRSGKKLMSGSAFVVFKQSRYRDLLLQEEEDDPVPSWILARNNTYFSFGRPPFASVTLTCERAPHPSDLCWQNLQVAWWQREFVFWILAFVLLFVMVVLVTVVRISEFVVPIMEVIKQELDNLEQMYAWQHYVPTELKTLVTTLNNADLWKSMLEQIPTVVLLFINSVVLPLTITAIAACERTVKLSDAERTRMLVNFFFLFTNTVVVPFCGVASLNELLEMLLKAVQEQANPEPFKGLIFASPGVFALKYIMNATFISSANQLTQIPQILNRWCQLTFLAVTNRHKKDVQEPWPFHWGYWYAWTLSVFALGINMSVACPSTLPLAALFFFVKYHVDKFNLDHGVYACGTDIEGGLAVRIVSYLRVVVSMWWFAMGALSGVIATFDPRGNLTDEEKLWLQRGGVALISLGVVTFAFTWWLRAHTLHRLKIHDPARKSGDTRTTFWEWLGGALYLRAPKSGTGSETLARSANTESLHTDAGSARVKNSKKKNQTLSWDGVQLLGLT